MNVAGLFLNFAGTLLLFVFGLPQPNFETGIPIVFEDNNIVEPGLTAKAYRIKMQRKKKFYRFMAYFSLSLISLGFLLQLLAVENVELNDLPKTMQASLINYHHLKKLFSYKA